LSVSVENRQRHVRVSSARLAAVARAALSSLRRVDRDLDVTVVGDREIRRLHERYLGVRRATDVLAFDLAGPGPSRLLGQVIISADTAARQAARLGVAVAQEMDLLLVHGLLHLAGYDDHDPRKARLMHEREHQILSRARRRPPPARLWAGLIDAGARALAPAARRRSLVRLSQRPLMVAGESSHRS
jgi:probable rRNA maturation factor